MLLNMRVWRGENSRFMCACDCGFERECVGGCESVSVSVPVKESLCMFVCTRERGCVSA